MIGVECNESTIYYSTSMIYWYCIYIFLAVTPPTDVEASMNQSGSIFVTWMQPTSQSPSVSGYRLFYTDGGTMKNVFLPGNTNQYVLQMTQAISNGVIRIRAETTDLVYLPSEIITAPSK